MIFRLSIADPEALEKGVQDQIESLPGFYRSDTGWILETESETLLERIEDLELIWKEVGGRAGVEFQIGNRNYGYREVFEAFFILRCAREKQLSSSAGSHCLDEDGRPGWGCRHLHNPAFYVPPFQRRDLVEAWFHCGHQDLEGNWKINREDILRKLEGEIQRRKLDVCPWLDQENLKRKVADLPESIETGRNQGFRIVERKNTENPGKPDLKIEARYWDENGKLIHPGTRPGTGGPGNQKTPEEKSIKERPLRNVPETSYRDIGGLDSTLRMIRDVVELPLKRPGLLKYYGIRPHRGILLSGPPGCGKTLIARAVAHEVQAHFIGIQGPELLSKWHGESEENLRSVFNEAREMAPSILFFDEIDALAMTRAGRSGGYEARMVQQLLTLMDGVERFSQVIVLAATNRKDTLDPALLRPGRFDYTLEIGYPDQEGIRKILEIQIRGMPLEPDLNLDPILASLNGHSGADVEFVAREAAYNGMRRNHPLESALKEPDRTDYRGTIQLEDFLKAVATLRERGEPDPVFD